MKVVYHIVLLSFKEDKFDEALSALSRLQQRLPGMKSITGGPYSSPEGLNQGYTHGIVMIFADAVARDNYLTHPEHEKVKNDILPFVDKVVAFDFEG